MNSSHLKIALVKQEVYQDLYVVPFTEKEPSSILFSSQGRVGPIGLIAELNADFYIVKEEQNWETQIYRKVIPHLSKHLYLLKTQTLDKLPGQQFKQPGSEHPNGKFAINCSEINWGEYDIVISINISLPTYIIKQYSKTLFAYMIGEANMITNRVGFGYDVSLNQQARGVLNDGCGTIDFPYTFLKGNTLQNIMQSSLNRLSRKRGVFMEINSTTERPVKTVPDHFLPLQHIGQEIIFHEQNIFNNLLNIYDSKYFVKLGGRKIRGNSVVEAISLGSLAIMNRDEIIHKELIIDECNVKSMEDVIALIKELESDSLKYFKLLEKQKKVVDNYFYEMPLSSLMKCLENKVNNKYLRKYTAVDKILDKISYFKLK